MVSLLKIISQGMMLDHSPATPKSVTGKKKAENFERFNFICNTQKKGKRGN